MLEALIAELASIEDPRCGWKVEHRLIDILVIAVCAVLGEAESFEDIALYGRCKQPWLEGFLELPNGIPSHDTFRRVFMLIDPEAFERSFLGWVRAVFRPEEDGPRQVAIGGSLRPCFDAFDDSHGRLVRRRVFACPDAGVFTTLAAWPGLRAVLAVETIRGIPGRGKVTAEIRHYLSSAKLPPEALAVAIRSHWRVENGLHWVLDVGFREDASRVRERNAARNLALLRKIALNLARADTTLKASLKGKRKYAGWDDTFMATLMAG